MCYTRNLTKLPHLSGKRSFRVRTAAYEKTRGGERGKRVVG